MFVCGAESGEVLIGDGGINQMVDTSMASANARRRRGECIRKSERSGAQVRKKSRRTTPKWE